MSPRTLARKRHFAAATAVALIAALSLGAASLLASPAKSPVAKRIFLVEREDNVRLVDLDKKGFSEGDVTAIRSDVLDRRRHVVGRLDSNCMVTGTRAKLGGICSEVITLKDGQIAVQSAYGASGVALRQSITGGTGAYAGARGEILLQKSKVTETNFTVTLLR